MDRGAHRWLLAVLIFVVPPVFTNQTCMPGIETPGITTPSGDIILEVGSPLRINCTLYPKNEYGINMDSSYLSFYEGDQEVPSKYIRRVNTTTIELNVNHLEKLSSKYYYCKYKHPEKEQPIPVCLNRVIVGTKPEEVQNFTCVSHNWKELECKWQIKYNPIKTVYRIYFNLPGRAGKRFNATCPTNTDEKFNFCVWNEKDSPIYRTPYQYYLFTLLGTNALGNVTFPQIQFHHYAHVIPAPPVMLQSHNITSNSVDLTWDIPQPLPLFPPGLFHRVKYRSSWSPIWHVANTSVLMNGPKSNLSYHLGGLTYPNTVYEIEVAMKSTTAVGDNKWSAPANMSIRTKPTVPGLPPNTDIGSFELVHDRDVYLYWQKIPDYLQNGDDFEYKIILEHENGNRKMINPHEITSTYAKIKGLSQKLNKFYIYSSNIVGLSKEGSQIIVPNHENKIPEPQSFTKIAFGNGVHELSWILPQHHEKLKSYTIFWCDSERDRPYQCTGNLNWTHVPSDVNIKNITVPEKKIYQFAISANTEYSSSGLIWATCTVIHNEGIGKMKQVWTNKVGSKFIELGWKLECSDRIGLVKGYKIFYCPTVSDDDKSCSDPIKNTTVSGSSLNIHGNITELLPFTTYKISVSVLTRGGEGLQSDPWTAKTSESAPEPPTELTVSDVTNTSMLVKWNKPIRSNGILKYYEIHYNQRIRKVDGELTNHHLHNLPSYTNITVHVIACTSYCSEPSESVTVQTLVGNPAVIDRLDVSRLKMNVSQFLVTWQPLSAELRGGSHGYYELRVIEDDSVLRNTTHNFNVTGTEFIIPVRECKSDDNPRTYYFSVRAVNLDMLGTKFIGPWSEQEKRDSCYDSGITQGSVIWWTCSFLVVMILMLAIWFYGKKCWSCCKEMQDVEVKIPPEFDTPTTSPRENFPMEMAQTANHSSNSGNSEEVVPLTRSERHGRNPSGDSSGCSSGQESVSSSLTSNTHISNDSGTEIDPGSNSWDLSGHGAQSTPNLAATELTEQEETPRLNRSTSCSSQLPTTPYCVISGNLEHQNNSRVPNTSHGYVMHHELVNFQGKANSGSVPNGSASPSLRALDTMKEVVQLEVIPEQSASAPRKENYVQLGSNKFHVTTTTPAGYVQIVTPPSSSSNSSSSSSSSNSSTSCHYVPHHIIQSPADTLS